jgi:hypothetical protein
MKLLLRISLYALMMTSCKKEAIKCACLGYDAEGRLSKVECSSCDKGLRESTCEALNKENLNGLTWVYDEGDTCQIPPPSTPTR